MRHVMVMNSKGGCGKSTIATNLASHFAGEGYKVAIADYDPQRTSLDWLAVSLRSTKVCAPCRATRKSW